MRKKLSMLLVPLVLILIASAFIFFTKKLTSKKAGLLVETTPSSTVYVNGESLGRTPLDVSLNSGEVLLKLVPDSFETPLALYETKISLTPGVKSVVFWDFASDSELSSGAVVSFEKSPGEEGSIAVVSYPESAQVFMEGTTKGFTPLKIEDLEKEVKLKTTIPGYHDKEITVTPKEGYLLTASIDLAKNPEYQAVLPAKEEQLSENKESKKEDKDEKKEASVKILPTPAGFLRVREEPVNGDEVAKVDSGKEFVYLEVDSDSGWYKIVYEDEKTGWVSDDYVEEVEVATEEET